ncbi:MAG: class I SAM-dependent methyltransferase [Pyrinomonadaceae bacterium]
MDSRGYHLQELAIANDLADFRRVMPAVKPEHHRILDVGCGAGQILIASNLATNVLAVGLDLDQEALQLGKELTDSVRFVRATGEALPFVDNSFDLLVCRVALPYMHVARAVKEMGRVLTSGGSLWAVLHPATMTIEELISNFFSFQPWAAFGRLWVFVNGLTLHIFDKQWPLLTKRDQFESWQTNRVVRRALTAANFKAIQITREKHFVVTAIKN